jgi:hypothetical protein
MKKAILIFVFMWMVALSNSAFASVEIERVVVGSFCRAWKYYDSTGAVSTVDIFKDSAVTDYGAAATVGSIQWGLDQLTATVGGTVRLYGTGNWPVATSIVISSGNTTLEGMNWGALLYVTNGANLADVIRYTNPASGTSYFSKIKNIQIDGNYTNQTGGAGTGVHVIRTGSSYYPNDFSIEDCFIKNCYGSGIWAEHTWGLRIINTLVEFNRANGLKLDVSGGGVVLNNLFIAYNVEYGIMSTASNVSGSNVYIYQSGRWGLGLIGGVNSGNSVFTSLILHDNGASGATYGSIYIQSPNNTINGAKISTSTVPTPNRAIILEGSNNVLTAVVAKTLAAIDVRISDTHTGNIISNNCYLPTISDANANGQGVMVLNKSPILADIDNQALVALDMGKVWTNLGDGNGTVFTLPEASTVLGRDITFVVLAAQNLDINPYDSTDQILGLTNAAGDAIRNATIGGTVTLLAVGNDAWVVQSSYGTWSDAN